VTVIFKQGDEVRYVPNHAEGDLNHKDCENGTVTSIKNGIVFVKYMCSDSVSKGCSPSNLVLFDDLSVTYNSRGTTKGARE